MTLDMRTGIRAADWCAAVRSLDPADIKPVTKDNLSSVDVASMGDFDSEDFNDAIGFDSDKGSVAELEWNTWDDACVWEFHNASGDFPPDSATCIAIPAVLLNDIVYPPDTSAVILYV